MADFDLRPQSTDEETLDLPWLQMENEPPQWFERFNKYYLPLGTGRTLLKAMMGYIVEEEPHKAEAWLANPRTSASVQWSEMASAWQWRLRARAYDTIRMRGAIAQMEEARAIIIENTPKAAKALVESLENPRLAVAAAKEILDRGGLPGTIVHENRVTPFTADELNQATREVQEWENKLLPKSDSSG
jgi:hypothetical protein